MLSAENAHHFRNIAAKIAKTPIMSATSMGVASKGGKAPDRGSFPLDHFAECK
jgi:hypothetical protein